ncbi:MAG TPA: small-conductance mechanosensitive ion channel [Chloroflexota bacterium]
MPVAPVTDWGVALMTSIAAALAIFLAAIPKIIGFVLIVLIGWFIAAAIAAVITRLLHMVRFNDMAQRSGLTDFVAKTGANTDPAALLATIAKWFVRLIVLEVAFDALGLPAVSTVLASLLLWLPNLVVALVVLVIGGVAANALAGLVRGSAAEAGIANPGMLASVARIAVWAFALVVAVSQIGIATTLVNTLFMGFVGALALALGLAFGLGGRETAAEIVRSWYQSGKQAAPRVAEAADAAQHRVSGPIGSVTPQPRAEEIPTRG